MRRRSIALLAGLAMAFTLGPSVSAQQTDELAFGSSRVQKGDYNSYIVIMKADPLVVTNGDRLNTRQAKNRAKKLRASHIQTLRDAGLSTNKVVNQYVTSLNGFSARVNYRQALRLAGDKDVALVLPDLLRQKQTDSSPEFLGLTGAASATSTGVTGEGVVVGVIDTGIWPEHPSFADNGSYGPSPVGPIPCEFGNTAHNPADVAFSCNNKLLGARQMLDTYRAVIGADPDEFDSARDDDGHGTHTTSTAAGNAGVDAWILGSPVGDGPIRGIAPRARVIAYKGLGNLGGFTSDLAAAIDQAVADGVDVINYSIGGGASTTMGADEIAFLFAADAGVFAATSAGNSGPGPGTVGSPGTVPWLTTVGANTQSRFIQGTVELGNGMTFTGASVTDGTGGFHPLVDAADATVSGEDRCPSSVDSFGGLDPDDLLDPSIVDGAIVLCRRGGNARVDKGLAVLNAGGVGMVHYENSDVGNLFTDTHFVPTVHVDNTPGMAIKSYIASASSPTAEIRDTRVNSTWPYAPSMTDFSSRGPNIFSDIIKPDITAPGLQILAGASPFADPGFPQGELFQAIAGTSMSSPHVAGLFALLKQAHPGWSAAAAKSALMTTSYQDVLDNDRTSQANPFAMGAGHADPGKAVRKGSSFQPGLVYDAGFLDYLGFLCDSDPSVFANPAATCGLLESLGVPTTAENLNYPSIGIGDLPGSATVWRTVTSVAQESGWRTYNVSVDAPPGYDVTVSPSTIKLKKGQSATFSVTIDNVSAPIGEWRFGSLTWEERTGHYSVYSPIAVKGSLFSAPEEVSGSGESGSTSFDVKFGYTGPYDAAPHGLVPATVTSDNVLQDPDQDFDPSDVGAGGANLHSFAVSGSAVFRIAMPADATEPNADLDIFVYKGGSLIASSTSGGTNELINFENPADGTYDVYVHGWSAPGGDSDYDLYTWDIPATPGGTLVIDSEPADATSGETGTINLSWTGATAGQWHFGAVSHWMADAPGSGLSDPNFMGLTLIEVDNR